MSRAQPDRVTYGGLLIVGAVAAVWSFTALTDLAAILGIRTVIDLPGVGWHIRIAWGLPLTVDVLAVIATRAWLRGDAPPEALVYARRAAWGAIGATIAGNAYHGLLQNDAWRIDSLIVSAVPAVALGVISHLAVYLGIVRTPTTAIVPALPPPVVDDSRQPELEPELVTQSLPAVESEPVVEPESPGTPLEQRVAQIRAHLAAGGIDRLTAITRVRDAHSRAGEPAPSQRQLAELLGLERHHIRTALTGTDR